MGCGLLRELQLYKKITLGGGLRDRSGCGNLSGSTTHGLASKTRNCCKACHHDAFSQAPNAYWNVEFLTAVQSGA